jgi:hypothetical protein
MHAFYSLPANAGTGKVVEAILTRSRLHAMAQVLIGPVEDKNDAPIKTPEYTIGTLLQKLGTEVGRKLIYDAIWVDAAAVDVAAARKRGSVVVVPDVRFDNESAYLDSVGGVTIGIDIFGAEWYAKKLAVTSAGRDTKHVSEKKLDSVKIWVKNTSTVTAFTQAVTDLFTQ